MASKEPHAEISIQELELIECINFANPFFLLMDRQGTMLRAGENFVKAVPNLSPGLLFSDFFQWAKPFAPADVLQPEVKSNIIRFFYTRDNRQKYKCSIRRRDDQTYFVFASPVINAYFPIHHYKFSISDFPKHDYISEFLFLQQAATKGIDDATKLNEMLLKKNQLIHSLSEVNSLFVKVDDVHQAIAESFQMVSTTLEIDTLVYYKVDPGSDTAVLMMKWNGREGLQPCSQNLSLSDIAPLRAQLVATGQSIVLAEENNEIMSLAAQHGLSSVVVFPLLVNKEFYGFIGFGDIDGHRDWAVDEIAFLKNISTSITSALENALQKVELIKLNNSLEGSLKKLEMAYEDLEQFAYVASHDLQEPLRTIANFMDLLRLNYSDQLDEKARKYVDYAVNGALRMKSIINDLLTYSQVGTREDLEEEIDLNSIVEDYQVLRDSLIRSKQAQITVETLPVIVSLRAPLSQVIHNLLDNALKYHKPGEIPVIDISVQEQEHRYILCIADNGIGIDSNDFERIFTIFQRLHSRDEYQGTGIGLAIVKKHVSSWGGEIWLESIVGQGTKFFFTVGKTT
jgi:signal transduction histidine kinase